MNLFKKLIISSISILVLFLNFGFSQIYDVYPPGRTEYMRLSFFEIFLKITNIVMFVLVILGFIYIVIGVINLIKSASIKDKLEEIELID